MSIRVWVAAAFLLALFAGRCIAGLSELSATSDEVSHLPAGYTYWATGDFRLNPQHPPLAKLLAALPLLVLKPRLDLSDPGWTSVPPDEWGFGYRFLYGENDGNRLLFWGRIPTVVLGALLGVIVFLWSRDLFGDRGALLSLFAFAFCPNLIGHGRWVTMDMALACFATLTLWLLHRWLQRGGTARLLACGVALGLALASKFSAVVLPPIVVVLVALAVLADGRRPGGTRRLGPRAAALGVGSIFGVAAVVVWASYFFPANPLAYLDGLRRVNADRIPGYAYYLGGAFSPTGFWDYFLVAFAIKTPLPALAVTAMSFAFLRRFRAATWLDEAMWLVPVAVWLGVTSALADDIGLRYLLPVYPLLYVAAGRLAGATDLWRRPAWAIAVVLAVWTVVTSARIFPDEVAYFNELVGGPANGWRWLDDSNLDWGQDMKRLKDVIDRERITEPVKLHYFGNASPDAYGIRYVRIGNREIDAERPAPGVYAVSAQILIRAQLRADRRGTRGDWLRRYKPFARAGYSIYLFRF